MCQSERRYVNQAIEKRKRNCTVNVKVAIASSFIFEGEGCASKAGVFQII